MSHWKPRRVRPIDNDLLLRLALALGAGLIVGVERGWRRRNEPEGGRTAGVRTFALIGLLGGLCGALSAQAGTVVPWVAAFAALTVVFGVFSYRESQAERDFSVTNLVAAMTVFVIGVLATTGDMRAAGSAAVVTAGLLASRENLHRVVARLSWLELRSALLLLAMTVVVLPLLPDRTVDPLGSINPRELWLLMILVAAVSYCGYLALKIAGPDKGPPIAGFAGGLASSTATTIAMARLSRRADDSRGLGAGVSFAAMVSLIRASLLAVVVQPAIGPLLAAPVAAAAAVFALGGVAPLLRRPARHDLKSEIGIPFEFSAVLGFGALLVGVSFLGAWIQQWAGPAGSYAFAAASGSVDVDAITLSTARSVERGASPAFAASTILVALTSNAVQRSAFAWIFGSAAFARRFTILTVLAIAAAGLAYAAATRFGAAGPLPGG